MPYRLSTRPRRRLLPAAGGLMLILATAMGALWAWQQATAPGRWPIRQVAVAGDLPSACQARVKATLARHTDAGLWALPLASLDRQLEALPWVRSARLRRQWPDRLEVRIQRHHAVARWGREAALNAQAQVFTPPVAEVPADLPQLIGPPGSAAKLWTRYQALAPHLAELGLTLQILRMDRRQAWHLQVTDDLAIALGRSEVAARFARFLRAYPRITPPPGKRLARVDMRYSNGLAVAWQATEPTPQPDEDNNG